MDIKKFDKEEQEKILGTYIDSLKKNQPVVFCVNCGSTNLDQNSTSEIQCYNCRVKGIWNGKKFGVARNGRIQDVISAITPPTDPFYFTDWRSQMLLSIEEFFQSVNSIILTGDEMVEENDYHKLSEEWKTLQSRIELFFKGIKIKPEE